MDSEPPVKPKRKSTKKQNPEGASKKQKGMIQLTLDRWLHKPRTPTRVRFKERVLLKEITPYIESWTTVPLKGFSDPYSAFELKRIEMKRAMSRNHQRRRNRLTTKTVRRVTHVLKRMQRENIKLGY